MKNKGRDRGAKTALRGSCIQHGDLLDTTYHVSKRITSPFFRRYKKPERRKSRDFIRKQLYNRLGNGSLIDTMVHDALTDAFDNYHMGITAENICDDWKLTREELDEFAANSQQKAVKAIFSGAVTGSTESCGKPSDAICKTSSTKSRLNFVNVPRT